MNLSPKQMLIVLAALEQYKNYFEVDKLFHEAHEVQTVIDLFPSEVELFEQGLANILDIEEDE